MSALRFALGFLVCHSVCIAAPRVVVFDDAVPGQDRSANAALKQVLVKRGYEVESRSVQSFAEGLKDPSVALVVPSCDAVPREIALAALKHVRRGGPTVFLGGPLLDHEVVPLNGAWYTPAMIAEELGRAPIGFRPPALRDSFLPAAWRRSRGAGANPDSFIRREGEGLHLSVGPLVNWDIEFSPSGIALYGAEESLFAFTARADDPETTLSIEMIERDGSRWIATTTIGTEWSRKVLRPEDFKYWHDSQAKNRGGQGDCFKPAQAQCIGLGISSSHTPMMSGRRASVHFREIGSCRSPFAVSKASSKISLSDLEALAQDGVFPRYKLLERDGAARAIFRPVGEGFGRGTFQRFKSLTEEKGVAAEWMLLERRPDLPERCLAGFGEKAWAKPEILDRMGAALDRMLKGSTLFEAGSRRFAYEPGQDVELGASWRGPATTARILVKDERRMDVFAATVSKGASVVWTPPAVPAVYRVETRLEDDVIEHEFAVISSEADPKADFISVKGGDFVLHGEKWYPVGMNFWPLYVAGMDHRDYWAGWIRNEYYAPSLVEWDLAHFAAMGGNMISIQAPGLGHVHNLWDVLRRCRRHGIYVNLFVPQASPLDTRFVPRAVPGETRPSELAEYLAAARLAGNATVFAYDTIWEPGNHVFRDDKARARWDADWRTWLVENYGGVEAAERAWGTKARRNAKGEVISPEGRWFIEDGAWRVQMADYRRFMDNVTSRAWNRATRALKALDPNHLVSFRQGNTLPYDFALTGPVRHIDFICPEGYAVPHTDAGEDAIGWITRYVDATTGGKPVVWSEFGKSIWNGTRMESDLKAAVTQGAYQERFYRTGLLAGANGTAPWWWTGGYRVGERSDFGVVSPDGAERPAAKLVRDYALRYRKPRAKPTPGVWMDFDRDAHAGGYCRAAFHEGATAWRAARGEGKILGVRLAGTDKTSVDAEWRHLDAEVDSLTCMREGNRIRVTAVFGIVGMASWVPAKVGKGGVWLVARNDQGMVVAKAPLVCPVPRLGASEPLSLSLPVGEKVKVRLEAEGRFAFGEGRMIAALEECR